MVENNYYSKYLKYKQKYLKQKNLQIGGKLIKITIKIKDIDINGRSYASIMDKSRYFLLDNIKPKLINSEKIHRLKTKAEKFSFMKTSNHVKLFYICLYPSSIDENCFCSLEKKVCFFLGCGKIFSANLFCDANNIHIYL